MRRRWKKRRIMVFCSIFFIALIIFSYYFGIVLPVVETYTKAETSAITEKAVNMAVSSVINRSLSYDKLIDINYNANGEISSFSANQYEINTITREIVKETQQQMLSFGEDGLRLNIGTFSGVPFFIGKGPKINLKLVPIGVVNGEFNSVFNSVGINMTRHTLFLNVNVHVSIVLPIKSFDIYSQNQVLLAESVILGKVPEVYFNGGGIGKTLNLIP